MGKFNSKFEQLESRTVSWNGLCSKFEVPLYLCAFIGTTVMYIYAYTYTVYYYTWFVQLYVIYKLVLLTEHTFDGLTRPKVVGGEGMNNQINY
jgi:hypothetical protein